MKRVLLSILALDLCAGALAIPAKQGTISYTQPDGTVISLKIVGDEHGHLMYSSSGFLVVDSDGLLEYAEFDEKGFPVASGVPVGAEDNEGSLPARLQSKEMIDRWNIKLSHNRSERLERLVRNSSNFAMTRGKEDDYLVDSGRLVPLNFGRCDASFPVVGDQKGIVILVEYEDVAFEYGDLNYFCRMLNQEGFSDYGSLGSVRDWFIKNSAGRFRPEFDVYGPVKLHEKRVYYGGNDKYGNDLHPEEMAIHACQILDENVDFSQYDRDGDGIIDNIFIFYAGNGEHDSGLADAVWPHSWNIVSGGSAQPEEGYVFDGVKLDHYACSCELPNRYNRPDGIGTFVHEFSHVMGLPDLYNTANVSDYTPGEWSVMDQGSYNNFGLTPPNYSSYEKCALGWLEFLPLREGRIELPDFSSTDIAYALPTENENEFFFFENRQPYGNDEFLPGHGMLVWHVDYKKSEWFYNSVNNLSSHQCVDLIEADNIMNKAIRTDADPFPGSKGVNALGFDTEPKLSSWGNLRLAYDLEGIVESEDGIVSFNAVAYDANRVNGIQGKNVTDGVYYDLTGRPVFNPGKGIYIRDGRKILIYGN